MAHAVLDADRLVSAACEATGLSDFGCDSWREGLERLLASQLDEGRLSELGEQIAAGEIIDYLSNRLRITDWHASHPELADIDVRPPIVIVGQPRTGTTILFDLLAQDPANRVPLTWEVDRPWPPPRTETYDTDPRIAEVQATLEGSELLIPGFLGMHPMGARLGQECVLITGGEFRSMIFPTQYRIPSYLDWLTREADMAPAYRYHRRFLQYLASEHPAQRWLLKSPAHLWSLPELVTEYPDALVVQTHRDPLRVVASLASDSTSVPEAAAEWVEVIAEGLDRSVAARLDGTLAPAAVDVQFADFMADPMATIGAIYDRLGITLTAEAERAMREFLTANPQDKHGGHSYTFTDTGLSAPALRERTRAYVEHFGVAEEPLD